MNSKIKIMLDEKQYNKKPQGKEIGVIQNRIKAADTTIPNLAEYIVRGQSFKPSFLLGKGEDSWQSQQLFCLDFDDNTTIKRELERCRKLDILPAFGYTTFSHSELHNKFRLVFKTDKVITDYNIAKQIQNTLLQIFNNADKQCSNLSRLFFGGKELIYADYNNTICYKNILNKYKGEKSDHNNKSIINSNYCSHINPFTYKEDINYNIQAIKDGNIKYLQSVLNIEDKIILQNEQEFYDYITTQINLPKLLGIDNPDSFKCIFHNDNSPSANIFKGKDGAWIYKCFSGSCGFKGNIIHVVQALTKKKTYKVIEYIKEIYNIEIQKTDWQKEQQAILETNKQMLLNGDFEEYYPNTYKLIARYIPQLIVLHDIAIMNVRDQNYIDSDGNIVFFISNRELAKIMDNNNSKRINQRNVLFAFLKLLKKLDKEEIPEEDLKKALAIQKKYKHTKIVNYFSLGDYNIYKLKESEQRAELWQEKNMTMRGLSYEGLYRTFGQDIAWEVYPQHKNKYIKTDEGYKIVNRTTTKASDERTIQIAKIIMQEIDKKGYCTEKQVIEQLKHKYGKTFTQTQIKRSLQEILDNYNLKRIRCNKKIKEQYGVAENGYPFIIVKSEVI